ncbi:hypothetical protein HS125_06360 [bacterium]|nr:hypothetical protein [bacterium]
MNRKTWHKTIGILALLASLWAPAVRADNVQDNFKMFFAGVVGEQGDGRRKILLRWYGLEGRPPFSDYIVYCKEGAPDATGTWQKITETGKIRNLATIRSIFERAGEEKVFADLFAQLSASCPSCSTPTPDTYAARLVEVLDATDETSEFRKTMLVQSNYGVALVEGVGYIDRRLPGVYTMIPCDQRAGRDHRSGPRPHHRGRQQRHPPARPAAIVGDLHRVSQPRARLSQVGTGRGLVQGRALSFGFDLYRFPVPCRAERPSSRWKRRTL